MPNWCFQHSGGRGSTGTQESTLHKQQLGPGQLSSLLTSCFRGCKSRKRPGCYGNTKDGKGTER